MENKESKKSRLAEILGVEVGEKFRIQTNGGFMTFEVTTEGHFKTDPPQQVGSTYLLLDAINHPEKIIRKPRLTPEELAICKALGGEVGEQERFWIKSRIMGYEAKQNF